MNKEQLHRNLANRPIAIYVMVGLFAFGLRLYLNFSQELIAGINGGYYPLQVRSILTTGSLGFSDMPLLFYLDAFIIKFISLFGFSITDTLIINVVKIVDCISIPLLIIPLYKIIQFEGNKSSNIFETSVISFVVLSLPSFILISDLQKNALAITFVFFNIAHLIAYQNSKKTIHIILSFMYLVITGLTHFGTLTFALFFLGLIIGFEYKKRAIIPLLIILFIGLTTIAIFDIARLNRLLSVGSLIFEKPSLTHGMLSPPDFLIILISIVLAIIGIIVLKTKSSNLLLHQKAVLFACIICLLTLSFPLLDGEYFRRLSLFLFIPQALILIQISSQINIKQIKVFSIPIFLFTLLSILSVFGRPKEVVINEEAYEDLKKLNSTVKNDNQTIVIARHGLEWWTAWALKTKVGQDKAMAGDFYVKYGNIIILNQISGFSSNQQRTPFHEPIVPENSQMIHSSKYFKAFKTNFNQ